MASINLDLNYFGHIKTLRLVARLGPGSDVLPIKVWVYAGQHHPESGQLALLETELEHICAWWGEKGVMVSAMIETGFLKREGDLIVINDWLEHSGHLAVFKKRAEKAAKIRWGIRRKSSNASSIAKPEVKQCPSRAVHSSSLLAKQVVTKRPPFTPPNPADVAEYAKGIGYTLDGQRFCDHYAARGWQYKNGSPMKDWQAAVRTWKTNEHKFGGQHGTNVSASVSGVAASFERSRQIRRASGLRKISESGARSVLDGIRSEPVDTPELPDDETGKPVGE